MVTVGVSNHFFVSLLKLLQSYVRNIYCSSSLKDNKKNNEDPNLLRMGTKYLYSIIPYQMSSYHRLLFLLYFSSENLSIYHFIVEIFFLSICPYFNINNKIFYDMEWNPPSSSDHHSSG